MSRGFHAAFDWRTLEPKGRPLGDRALLRLQGSGGTWFELLYREEFVTEGLFDRLVRKTLVRVEEHRGRALVRSETVDREVAVKPPKPLPASDDPDFF